MRVQYIVILSFFFLGMTCINKGEKMDIGYKKAVTIAQNRLTEENFDLDNSEVVIDPRNTIWNKNYLENENFTKHNKHLLEQLKDKEYWAIQYRTKSPNVFGGGAWVLVDKHEEKVILVFYSK